MVASVGWSEIEVDGEAEDSLGVAIVALLGEELGIDVLGFTEGLEDCDLLGAALGSLVEGRELGFVEGDPVFKF